MRSLHPPLFIGCLLLSAAASQAAPKPCKDLEAEVAAKLDAKGVKGYELAIVEANKAGTAQVVGSCEGGSKRLTLVRK